MNRTDEYDVAVSDAEDDSVNTLAFTLVDIVIPLARDADGDPFQDDEVKLRSHDGSFEQLLRVDSPDVEENSGDLLLYHFRAVPRGVYGVWICIGGRWTEVMRALIVSKRGVYHQGRRMSEAPPSPEGE